MSQTVSTVDYMCFKEKKCTTRELYDAIMANWEGYEELHQYIKNEAPHYGNAIPEVDKWAARASGVFASAVNKCTGMRGRFSAGLYPVTTNVIFGAMSDATPDRRYRGSPLPTESPMQQMDKNGPTAVLTSVSVIDQTVYPNGTLLNMKFHRNAEGRARHRKNVPAYTDLFLLGRYGDPAQLCQLGDAPGRAEESSSTEPCRSRGRLFGLLCRAAQGVPERPDLPDRTYELDRFQLTREFNAINGVDAT